MADKEIVGSSGIKYKKGSSESWVCSICKKEGTVRVKTGTALEKVFEQMLSRHRLKSPSCVDDHVALKNKVLGALLGITYGKG